MNSNLNDPEFLDAIIENQHLLLSCSSSTAAKTTNKTSTDTIEHNLFLTPLERQNIEEKIANEEEIIEEVSNFNIFDLLQSEDRLEMTSLLEAVNNSVDFVSYLPQISVNSANKILENVELDTPVEQECVQEEFFLNSNNDNGSIDQFSQLCDLFSINQEIKAETPPLDSSNPQTNQLKPARSSVRLASKKPNLNSNEIYEFTQIKPANKRSPKSYLGENKKRKRSIDSDEYALNLGAVSENASVIESNENSLDSSGLNESNSLSNKRRYSKFNESQGENSNNSSSFEDDDFMGNGDENSNDREFKNYVRRYERETALNEKRGKTRFSLLDENPVKKESNKEAATRYRLKKLSEKDTMFDTRMHLEKENENVKKKIELAQTEISYLKNLLVQMLLTKGVL